MDDCIRELIDASRHAARFLGSPTTLEVPDGVTDTGAWARRESNLAKERLNAALLVLEGEPAQTLK